MTTERDLLLGLLRAHVLVTQQTIVAIEHTNVVPPETAISHSQLVKSAADATAMFAAHREYLRVLSHTAYAVTNHLGLLFESICGADSLKRHGRDAAEPGWFLQYFENKRPDLLPDQSSESAAVLRDFLSSENAKEQGQ